MSSFDPQKHHRRSIRLKGYDYAQAGAYFITIVTQGRVCLFAEVVNGEMVLNDFGKIVQKWWDDLSTHFPGIETGAFVIMPNHVHGVIIIVNHGRGAVPAPLISETDNAAESTPDDAMSTIGRGDPGRGDPGRGDPGRGDPAPTMRKPTLGQIVAYFKYKSTKEMNSMDTSGAITKFWQRNYYERIIRNEREMDAIWNYIENNPSTWADDNENPNERFENT